MHVGLRSGKTCQSEGIIVSEELTLSHQSSAIDSSP